MNILDGTEIIQLIGLPESDDKILDLIEALGVDVSEIERDEDDESYWIELSDILGVDLNFNDVAYSEKQKNLNIGGLYLNDINFQSNYNFLPYGIEINDTLETIENKIGKKANYIRLEENGEPDEEVLYWIYENLGVFSIQFEDNQQNSIIAIDIMPYENPASEGFDELIKPYFR